MAPDLEMSAHTFSFPKPQDLAQGEGEGQGRGRVEMNQQEGHKWKRVELSLEQGVGELGVGIEASRHLGVRFGDKGNLVQI